MYRNSSYQQRRPYYNSYNSNRTTSMINRRPKPRYNQTKRLVTGHGPTMLEQIASGAGSVAKLASAVLPAIAAINTELKYFDNKGTSEPLSGNPTITPLFNMPIGTSDSGRIGNSVLTKDVQLRLRLLPNWSQSAEPILPEFQEIRIILFVDKFGNGTYPQPDELFEDPTYLLSPLNRDYSDRFVILKDYMTVLSNYGNQAELTKYYKKLDFHTRYLGEGNQPADIGPNQIYLYTASTAISTAPTIQHYSRINFTDN